VLERYRLWTKVPGSVRRLLSDGRAGKHPETPTSDHPCFRSCTTATLANHQSSALALAAWTKSRGWQPRVLSTTLTGEARLVGPQLIRKAQRLLPRASKKPQIFIWSGETTVTVQGQGKGGRNQELVLAALPHLQQNMTIASIGTDGIDGINPRPVAGAVGTASLLAKAQQKNLEVKKYLHNNDSYHFFHKVGGHIITGPTGTNVGDLVAILTW